MKKFLIKTLIFISFGIIAYLLSFVYLKNNLKETINKNEVILLGDSHTVSLDISRTFNYSISGAPYILHYNFAKNFENQFKNKTIIIAFGFHNVANFYENRFNGTSVKKGWIPMINNELNSYNLMDKSYKYDWVNNNGISDIITKKKLLKLYELSSNQIRVNNDFIANDTLLFNKTLEKHYSSNYTSSDVIQIKYLTMLVDLLKKNNCTVYLINTPITDYYYTNVPADIKEYYSEVLSKLDVKYLDLNKILDGQINASCFKDADHVNNKGDEIIIEYLEKEILEN